MSIGVLLMTGPDDAKATKAEDVRTRRETLRDEARACPPVMPDLHVKVTGLSGSANLRIAMQTMQRRMHAVIAIADHDLIDIIYREALIATSPSLLRMPAWLPCFLPLMRRPRRSSNA
jgi:hypothetical protein